MKQRPKIVVWAWEDAPGIYKALSRNGGDEDYIAFVPDDWPYHDPLWLDEGSAFGCCAVERHEVERGHILIGCHA